MIDIKKKLQGAKRRLIFYILYLKAIIYKFFWGEKKIAFLLGTPWHGNLGDQAIAYSEILFLKEKVERHVIEIPSQYVMLYINSWKKIIGGHDILVHGGGFIGSLWPDEDRMMRGVLNAFKENKIIVLPQTIYFEGENKKDIDRYGLILKDRKNVTICIRERYSYENAVRYGFKHIQLIPDMVTFLHLDDIGDEIIEKNDKNTILLCLRNDHEKTLDHDRCIQTLRHMGVYPIRYTDTCIERTIYPFARRKEIIKKIKEFSRAEIVVTDRLHGMVFSALAETPCIVFDNCDHKVKGVYDWIANNRYIKFIENVDQMEEAFIYLKGIRDLGYDNHDLMDHQIRLKEMIGGKCV